MHLFFLHKNKVKVTIVMVWENGSTASGKYFSLADWCNFDKCVDSTADDLEIFYQVK